MSYQEKRTITSISTCVLLLAAYLIYAFSPARLGRVGSDDLSAWSITMLIFMGIGIAATIIIQIIFHILLSISIAVRAKMQDQECDEEDIERSVNSEMVEDERDKIIELKSNRVGFIVAGIGFLGALVSQVLHYSPVIMLNILFIAFSFGSICEGIAQLVYYRKGM